MAEWREATWEEERDELAAHLAFLHRSLREAGQFPEDVDPDEQAMRLTFNYLSGVLDRDRQSSPWGEQVRRVLRLTAEPPPLTRH